MLQYMFNLLHVVTCLLIIQQRFYTINAASSSEEDPQETHPSGYEFPLNYLDDSEGYTEPVAVDPDTFATISAPERRPAARDESEEEEEEEELFENNQNRPLQNGQSNDEKMSQTILSGDTKHETHDRDNQAHANNVESMPTEPTEDDAKSACESELEQQEGEEIEVIEKGKLEKEEDRQNSQSNEETTSREISVDDAKNETQDSHESDELKHDHNNSESTAAESAEGVDISDSELPVLQASDLSNDNVKAPIDSKISQATDSSTEAAKSATSGLAQDADTSSDKTAVHSDNDDAKPTNDSWLNGDSMWAFFNNVTAWFYANNTTGENQSLTSDLSQDADISSDETAVHSDNNSKSRLNKTCAENIELDLLSKEDLKQAISICLSEIWGNIKSSFNNTWNIIKLIWYLICTYGSNVKGYVAETLFDVVSLFIFADKEDVTIPGLAVVVFVISVMLIGLCFTKRVSQCSKCNGGKHCYFCRCCPGEKNYRFYTNKLAARPDGENIETMLQTLDHNYKELESRHGYIQWLFPINTDGVNWDASKLTTREAELIKRNPVARARLVKAYKMMLDFYGVSLVNEETGEVKRNSDWQKRYANMTQNTHNFLRITRIISSLGLLGYEHYQEPFLDHLIQDVTKRLLPGAHRSLTHHWIPAVTNPDVRDSMLQNVGNGNNAYGYTNGLTSYQGRDIVNRKNGPSDGLPGRPLSHSAGSKGNRKGKTKRR